MDSFKLSSFREADYTPSERLAAPVLLRPISATQLPNGPSETEHGVFRYLGVSLLSGAKGYDLIRSDGLTWVSSEPRHRSQRGPENDRDGADLNHDAADHDLDPADRGQHGRETITMKACKS